MKPTKAGQIARFHTPLQDEDPNQLYVVLEVIEDGKNSRAKIKDLNGGLPFTPVNKVRLRDLEVVEVGTDDLIGHTVKIKKSDNSEVEGKIIKCSVQKIMLDLTIVDKGVNTNVYVTILDKNSVEHTGLLLVK